MIESQNPTDVINTIKNWNNDKEIKIFDVLQNNDEKNILDN